MAIEALFKHVASRKSIQSSSSDPMADAALGYLARRARTVAQVKAYLARKGSSPAKTRSLIVKFEKLGYLDDREYAQRWARDRLARKPMGRERLTAELQAQGVDDWIVAETVEAVYQENSEYHLIVDLSRKKPVSAALLRSRGFHEDVIASFVGEAPSSSIEGESIHE